MTALRADARRNRARVLDAAEAVFATKGTSASTEEVASEAGVGIGTVFRHFPTKEALLKAVFLARLRRLADEAESLTTADDPGGAFFGFVTRMVEQAAGKNALVDALAEAGVRVELVTSPDGQDLLRAVGTLLARAQRAGAVRGDLGVADLIAVLVGASQAAEFAGHDREVQSRALAVVLDGLRPR